MHIINITVRNKIAVNPAQDRYVCGNSDFVVHFDFDSEWDAFETKTARFIKEDGTHQDQVFSGNDCPVPVISDTYKIMVGVFAGNLSTTTAAYVPAKKSILCGGGVPAAPADDVYNQIMARLDSVPPKTKEPHMQIVTDKDGKAVWEERLAWKEVTTQKGYITVVHDAELVDMGEGTYELTTPLVSSPVAGITYAINWGGNEYTSKCVDASAMANGAEAYVFGNTAAIGYDVPVENPDPYATFCVLLAPAGEEGAYGMIMSADSIASPVLTIRSAEEVETTTTDIKTIDPDLIERRKITLTVDSEGNVTSDIDFDTAWAMDAAALQAAITVKAEGLPYSVGRMSSNCAPVGVNKDVIADGMYKMITVRYKTDVDYSDLNGSRAETRIIEWASEGIRLLQYAVSDVPTNLLANTKYYLRWNNGWNAVTIDQLKEDLGLT